MDGMINTDSTWNFPVAFKDMTYTSDGLNLHDVPTDLGRVLVRTDTNEPLAIHKQRYTIQTNEECINQMDDAIRAANIGRDYEWNIQPVDNGKRMKATVDFRDLVVQPVKDDYIHFRVSVFNSYDGTWSFIFSAAGLRLWCLNGCTTPDNVATSRSKHTASINVQQEALKIGKAVDMFMNNQELWNRYVHTDIRHMQSVAEQMISDELCKIPSATSKFKYNERQLEILMRTLNNEFSKLGPNMWALYNTLTHWASHPEHNRADDAITTRNRDEQIARCMQSKLWKELENA
mgnify:FL=1